MKTKNKQPYLIPTEGFAFDADTHSYYFNGKPMTGVTTILGVIGKPLTWWAAGKALEGMGWKNKKFCSKDELIAAAQEGLEKLRNMEPQAFADFLQECYGAHNKNKEAAGEHGSDLHGRIEEWVKVCIEHYGGKPIPEANEDFKKLQVWALENDIIFTESEKKLYSQEYWYAGTLDILALKDGKPVILDIKTSAAIYPEHFFQMAAYRLAWEEQGGEPLVGAAVIRIGKDGSFEVGWRYDYETDKKAFLGALDIYRAKATFN